MTVTAVQYNQFVESVQRKPSPCTVIQSLALLIFASIPVGLFCLSIRHCGGQKLADKLMVTVVLHSIDNLRGLNPKLLTSAKNLARLDVIWKEEDLKLGVEYLEKLGLKRSLSRGAIRQGICYGASLVIVQDLFNRTIRNEQELIGATAKYRDGFSAKASALQVTYEEANKVKALYKVHELVGLKAYRGEHLKDNGIYLLGGCGHAFIFAKFDFGSYVMDPDEGLYRCLAPNIRYKNITCFTNCKKVTPSIHSKA